MSGRAPAAGEGSGDPSMEDILASIRRILSEDETAETPAAPAPTSAAPQPAPAPHPAVMEAPTPPPPGPAAPARPEVLDLDPSMLIEEEEETLPSPLPGAEQLPSLHAERTAEPPHPAPFEDRADAPASVAAPRPEPPPAPAAPPPAAADSTNHGLVAPDAAAAAAASVGSLLRSIGSRHAVAVRGGGPTIEDLVREELRPALKAWLDVHLPPMVERLVRAEIERVVGRAEF